ncbi:MAG TPA: MFS transporter [Herpetosiphonaceae bacterium]
MAQPTTDRGMTIFSIVWFGQLISLIGSGLTRFALGVWVYQLTNSVTLFAFITLAVALPGIVLAPFAGALVDRWDRRKVMIASDTGAAICTLAIALLLWGGNLALWHIYIAVGVSAVFNAFQMPAFMAAISLLVPKQHLGRANGMLQVSEAASQIVAPLLAGVLVLTIQLEGVILIDVITFLVGVAALLAVRFPEPERTAEGEEGRGSLLREAGYGLSYIAARPGLMGLLLFFAMINFTFNMIAVLYTPLLLKFTTAAALGSVMAISGAGFLVGSLIMSAWGGPQRKIYGVLGFGLLFGLSILLTGVYESTVLIAVAAFATMLWVPLINGSSAGIWHVKVAPDVQGRVFATRMMIAWSATPLSYILAGPLTDYVFEPLLLEGGALSGSVGQIVGVGAGRGIGLLFIALGLLTALAAVVGWLNPRVRLIEQELPDQIGDRAPAAADGQAQEAIPATS